MDRKSRVREYKQTARPAGIFVVRNTETGRTLLGSSENLPGSLNRQRFQLELGNHPDKELQAEFTALGLDAFVFEVLDELEPPEKPDGDLAADLAVLLAEWAERLEGEGVALYPTALRGAGRNGR